jgi:hypothetical protein
MPNPTTTSVRSKALDAADDAEEAVLDSLHGLRQDVRVLALRFLADSLATRAHAAECDMMAPSPERPHA